MAQQPDLAALARMQPDPEVFRRVWNRVMPDQKDSPIAISPPPKPVPPKPAPPRPAPPKPPAPPLRPAPPRRPVPPPQPRQAPAGELLRSLMDMAQEGAASAALLVRRAGNQGRALASMPAAFRQAQRRLSAAYFLETGARYQPPAAAPSRSVALPQALREQFLWEQDWCRACARAAGQSSDASLQSLLRELAREGESRRQTIRALLERI